MGDLRKALNDLYRICCSSEVTLEDSQEWVRLSAMDDVNEDFIRKVFEGELKEGQIHEGYYFEVAKKLSQAIAKGLGGATFSAGDGRNALAAHLQHNIYAFSAAKSTGAMEEYRNAMINEKGEVDSYAAFRNRAIAIGQEFNDQHLRTEYNSAVATAQMNAKYQRLQKYSHWEYRTVGDGRVRKEHAKLDGKVFASTDPIWDEIYPPNGWNCRCTVIPAQGSKPSLYTDEVKEGKKTIAPYFKRNAGKERVIFHDGHPLMSGMKTKPNELQAEKHYNMKSVQRIYEAAHKLPELEQLVTREAAEAWWEKHGNQEITGKDGLSVKLGDEFYSKMIGKYQGKYADRYQIAHKAPEVMKDPDEIWSHFHSGELQTVYLKYYQDKPYMVAVKESKGKMGFESFYGLDPQSAINKRKGVLKYRK